MHRLISQQTSYNIGRYPTVEFLESLDFAEIGPHEVADGPIAAKTFLYHNPLNSISIMAIPSLGREIECNIIDLNRCINKEDI